MRGHVRKRKNKWVGVIYLGQDKVTKKKQQKWLAGEETEKEAWKAVRKEIRKIEEIGRESYLISEKMPLNLYLDKWIKDYCIPNLKRKTVTGYENYIRTHIKPYIGELVMGDIKPLHLQELYDKLIREGRVDGKGGLSPATVIQVHRILSKALGRAYLHQLLTINPCNHVELPRKKKFKPKVIPVEEINDYINAFLDTDYYVPIILDISLGLRRGELLGLKWEDIDFERKILRIKRALYYDKEGLFFDKPKTDSSERTILINDGLFLLLQKHKEDQQKYKDMLGDDYNNLDLICCRQDGTPFKPDSFSKSWKRYITKAGLEYVRLHDIRHTNGTFMAMSDTHGKVGAMRLGHSTVSFYFDTYNHPNVEMQRSTAESLDSIVDYTKGIKHFEDKNER